MGKMKKWFVRILVLLVAVAMVGCGAPASTATTTAAGAAATTAATTAAAADDATTAAESDATTTAAEAGATSEAGGADGEVTKFTYWRDSFNGVAIQGWGNMEWMKEWEARNNVEIEFQGPPAGEDLNQATNIMIASGDYPEVIYFDWNNYSGGLRAAIDDGIVVDLGAKYRDKLPNWFALQEENENIRRAVTLDDGTSALLCHVEFDLKRAAYHGYAIRKDWLDKVSMEVPTTIDELYAFATAVTGKDMNGDGATDNYAFTDAAAGAGIPAFIRLLGAAWGLRVDGIGLDPDTQRITWWTEVDGGQAFTEYTETMAKWYAEGLFDPDSLSQDGTARDAQITQGKIGMFECFNANAGRWTEVLDTVVPGGEIYGMTMIKGADGKPYGTNDAHVRYAASNEGTAVTVTAEDNGSIDAILKFLDYGYSEEGDELINWGEEGVSFTREGDERVWTPLVTEDPEYNFGDIIVKYAIPVRGGWPKIMSYDAWYAAEVRNEAAATAHENYWLADTSLLVPPIMLSRTESEEYNRIMVDARTMINENFMQFLTGAKPTSEIPAFLESLKSSVDIASAIELYNSAYDRYLNK